MPSPDWSFFDRHQVRGILGESLLRLRERVARVAAQRDTPAPAGH
jgi:hypothetical protein